LASKQADQSLNILRFDGMSLKPRAKMGDSTSSKHRNKPMPKRLLVALIMVIMGSPIGSFGAPADATELGLLPKPVKLELKPGRFELNSHTVITAGAGANAEVEQLAALLRQPTGLTLPLGKPGLGQNSIGFILNPSLASSVGHEGYELSITAKEVAVLAADTAGLFYGGRTFLQLLPPEAFGPTPLVGSQKIRWLAPCLEIKDYPRFAWRGLLLDVARHYMPPDFLKKFVDVMALHKLNRLQLHLTDDQGWRLEIKKYPRLTAIGSVRKESPKQGNRNTGDGVPYGPFFYTQQEMRDLVTYAQARHVTIVPEIEIPGHFRAALAAYPEYSCTGGPFEVRTRWGIEPDILCAGNEAAIAFAQDVLDEVTAVFPSQFIHIGGDEAPTDRWKKCPKCQARLQTEGLKDERQLQGYLNRRLEKFLDSKGRRLIGWDEILEGGLAPGATVMSWRGTAGGTTAANAGHDVVMSPTTHCYFDYAQSKESGEPECIGGYVPLETVYAFEPVPSALAADKRGHILGAQGNVWTEYIWTPAQVEYFAFPRAAALAEVVWMPVEARDYGDFVLRLRKHLPRLNALGVNYRHLDTKSGR
jgi:hexosaminidase